MDRDTITISTRLDAMERPRSHTLSVFVLVIAALTFVVFAVVLAPRVLANTAATALQAQERALAYREGW